VSDENRTELCPHKWAFRVDLLPDGVLNLARYCVHCDTEDAMGSWPLAWSPEDE